MMQFLSEKILKDTDDWIFQRDPDDLYDYNKNRPFRDRLETPRGPGKGKQGPKPKSEEIVSFDTKKVYVKD